MIDGLSLEAVERATAVGHPRGVPAPGIVAITAGNYGGKLGPFHIRLHDVLGRYLSQDQTRRRSQYPSVLSEDPRNRSPSLFYEEPCRGLDRHRRFVVLMCVLIFLMFGPFFTVNQQTAAIVQRFGKFVRVAHSGLNFGRP